MSLTTEPMIRLVDFCIEPFIDMFGTKHRMYARSVTMSIEWWIGFYRETEQVVVVGAKNDFRHLSNLSPFPVQDYYSGLEEPSVNPRNKNVKKRMQMGKIIWYNHSSNQVNELIPDLYSKLCWKPAILRYPKLYLNDHKMFCKQWVAREELPYYVDDKIGLDFLDTNNLLNEGLRKYVGGEKPKDFEKLMDSIIKEDENL